MVETGDLPTPIPLLIAHAPTAQRARHALCWAIDERMARIVLGKREGAVAAIRLAWWEEALASGGAGARGEPMLEKWRALAANERDNAQVAAVAGAWRMLLDPEPMTEADWRVFGEGRGALFPLIAARDDEGLRRAGALWALWDVARRDADRQRAEGAFAAAIDIVERGAALPKGAPKALRLAAGMAADDAATRTPPQPGLTPRQYLRLLRRALFG